MREMLTMRNVLFLKTGFSVISSTMGGIEIQSHLLFALLKTQTVMPATIGVIASDMTARVHKA